MFRLSTSKGTGQVRSFCLGLTVASVFIFASLFFAQHAHSATANATVGWNADTSNVAGYTVYYGTSSGNYSSNVDVGNTTSYTITNLSGPTAYISSRPTTAAKSTAAMRRKW